MCKKKPIPIGFFYTFVFFTYFFFWKRILHFSGIFFGIIINFDEKSVKNELVSNFSVGQTVVSVGFWDFFQVFQLTRRSFQLAHENIAGFVSWLLRFFQVFSIGFWDLFSNFSVGQQVVSVGFWDFFRFFSWPVGHSSWLTWTLQAFSWPADHFSSPAVAAYSEGPPPSFSDLIDFDLASWGLIKNPKNS